MVEFKDPRIEEALKDMRKNQKWDFSHELIETEASWYFPTKNYFHKPLNEGTYFVVKSFIFKKEMIQEPAHFKRSGLVDYLFYPTNYPIENGYRVVKFNTPMKIVYGRAFDICNIDEAYAFGVVITERLI
jgi:hypothetical protein